LTHHGGDRATGMGEPLRTITCANRGEKALVMPVFVDTAHGEIDRNGRKRGRGYQDPHAPLPTVLTSGNSAVVAAFLAQHNNHRGTVPSDGRSPELPLSSVTTRPQQSVVAA